MFDEQHFISTPIRFILEDAVAATKPLPEGIDLFPACEYIIHTLLLRMTGFLEQKLKSMLWSVAEMDLEYRQTFVEKKRGSLGFSSYEDKNTAFGDVCSVLFRLAPDSPIFDSREDNSLKSDIRDETFNSIEATIGSSVLTSWDGRSYLRFKEGFETSFAKENFLISKKKGGQSPTVSSTLLGSVLQKEYSNLHKMRNDLAHNNLAHNLRSSPFVLFRNDVSVEKNFFVWFALLVLIDSVFINTFHDLKAVADRRF